MQGRRVLDGTKPKAPGEYAWMPYDGWEQKPPFFLGDGEWHVVDPTGGIGALGRMTSDQPAAHSIEIHEDGTITASPSLVMPSGWHGWLRRGEFTTA